MDYFTQLGDPQNKSASNADFHLTNLLADHPNMKVWLFHILMSSFMISSLICCLCSSLWLNLSLFLQAVVIDEVDSFLFRPHLGLRAKYHAVCHRLSFSCSSHSYMFSLSRTMLVNPYKLHRLIF